MGLIKYYERGSECAIGSGARRGGVVEVTFLITDIYRPDSIPL